MTGKKVELEYLVCPKLRESGKCKVFKPRNGKKGKELVLDSSNIEEMYFGFLNYEMSYTRSRAPVRTVLEEEERHFQIFLKHSETHSLML